MIGFVYNGQVEYITRIEDFRDYMDSAVYDALVKALECGITGGIYNAYEELKFDYDRLLSEYEDLEMQCDYLSDEAESADECRKECKEMEQKYELLHHSVEVLVNQLYLGYVPQEDIIPTLEKLI